FGESREPRESGESGESRESGETRESGESGQLWRLLSSARGRFIPMKIIQAGSIDARHFTSAGAFKAGNHQISITLVPNRENVADRLALGNVPRTVANDWHHNARGSRFLGPPKNGQGCNG